MTDSRAFKNMLQVRIGSRHVWALLDSGVNISVISDHLFQTLKSFFTKVQTPDFKQVSGVGGELHQVLSKVLVCFYVNNIQVSQDFHVISGRHDMILGLDFLCKYGVQVDFGLGNVSIGNTSAKLSSPGVVTCLAKSVSSVTLPKRHEAIVPVKCTRNLTNRLVLFNQTKGSSQVKSFTLTDTVTTVKGSNAYVRVLNKSPDVIVIPKGTVIAFGQSLNEADLAVVDPRDDSDVLSSQSSDDIIFNFDNPDISDSDKHKLSVFLKQNREVFAKSKVELKR